MINFVNERLVKNEMSGFHEWTFQTGSWSVVMSPGGWVENGLMLSNDKACKIDGKMNMKVREEVSGEDRHYVASKNAHGAVIAASYSIIRSLSFFQFSHCLCFSCKM